jgi:hypothetical protein
MNNQLIELLNSFKFHCEAYINQFKQLCEICEIPDKSELIGKEQLYEYGTEIKKINGWYKAKTPLSNPYLHPEFTGNRAAFDQYYYNKVNEVSRLLIDALNSYLIENSNHDAIKKLLRKDLDTYENFKDFECLKELENFKTAIKLIIEQSDYNEKNNGATPEFNRILELRKETEFYFKTDCSNVYGNNLEVMYNIQHLQDYKNFQKKIDSCNDAETLKAHLTETFRKWKGKKSQWIEYTSLSIAPPNSNNNVLKTSAWFEWFESHKEQESEPISNGLNNDKGTIDTKNLIINELNKIDKNKGWNYAFRSENDFELFVNLLTKYFTHSDYNLPKEIIKLKINTKTRFAASLKSLYNELSDIPFKSNVKYFEIIRTLNHFERLNDNEIYKALNK